MADFSRVLAGPYATMLLADMGATVLKIEHPDGGDDTRSWGPPWSDGLSTYFQAVNRNKRSFVCDLRVEEDRQVARQLCGQADVIVENFRSGTTEKLGLDPAQILADNPGAVYCSITGFGSGPGKELLGYDSSRPGPGWIELMSVTGEPGGPPVKVGVAIVDVVTGLHALAGILAALHHRDKTGQGQKIEVNLMSSLLSALVNQASSYLNTATVPAAMGNEHPSIAPYEMVTASDRPLVLAVGNDSQFRALCAELGLDALADDERFATNDVRVANRHALVRAMNAVFTTAPASLWVGDPTPARRRSLQAAGQRYRRGRWPWPDASVSTPSSTWPGPTARCRARSVIPSPTAPPRPPTTRPRRCGATSWGPASRNSGRSFLEERRR